MKQKTTFSVHRLLWSAIAVLLIPSIALCPLTKSSNLPNPPPQALIQEPVHDLVLPSTNLAQNTDPPPSQNTVFDVKNTTKTRKSTLTSYEARWYPHEQYEYRTMLSPSGTLYTQNQTMLTRLAASAGWNIFNNTNRSPVIAMIDTGFSLSHQALASRWHTNNAEADNPALDADTNGYNGDWRGWDFVHNDNDPSTNVQKHGTYTAALAGLINPNAQLMPLQVLDDNGVGYTDTITQAIYYAADNGANIISMSLGGTYDDQFMHDAIDYAISMGVLVVAAAGNSGCNCLSYPGNYPEVLTVGASDSSDTRAYFSSYGANLDVLAPGTANDVCSATISGANLTTAYSCALSGTSMATPIVAGFVALLLQQNSSPQPAQLITEVIKYAAHPPGMGDSTFTNEYGYGRISVGPTMAALTLSSASGVFLNRSTTSLSAATDWILSPEMNSTCIGAPGGTCQLTLTGPSGQTIDLGTHTLDTNGVTEFNWNVVTLNLTVGAWTITPSQSASGQSITGQTVSFQVIP